MSADSRGDGNGEVASFGDERKFSLCEGCRTCGCCGDSALLLGVSLVEPAAAAAASSFLLASNAFASTALAGSSSSSCLPKAVVEFGVSGKVTSFGGAGSINVRPRPPSLLLSTTLSFAGGATTSSASSEISFNLRRRKEELEEVNDPAEGCSMVDRPRDDSLSSEAVVKEKTVSCGVKVSRTD